MVRTPSFHCQEPGPVSDQGTKIFAGSIKNKKQNPKKQKREKREGELVGMRGDWFMTLDEVRGGHSGEIKNSMGFHWKLSMKVTPPPPPLPAPVSYFTLVTS